VLRAERELSSAFPISRKFAYEERNGKLVRQYSSEFSRKYNEQMSGMVERRMRQAVFAVASFWYTAWVDAGQPDLKGLSGKKFSKEEEKEFEELDKAWRKGGMREE
jgi:hypothetical protein